MAHTVELTLIHTGKSDVAIRFINVFTAEMALLLPISAMFA